MTPLTRRLLLVLSPLLLLVGAMGLLAFLTLSLRPLVEHPGTPDSAQVRHVEQWVVDNSPSSFQSAGATDISLSDDELNLLSAFVLHNIPLLQSLAAEFDIQGDSADARLSIPLPTGPLPLYLNVEARFEQDQGRARLQHLKAGYLPLPTVVIRALERVAVFQFAPSSDTSRDLAELRRSIVDYRLTQDRLQLRLEWAPDVLSKLRSQAQQLFVSDEDRQRILTYHNKIQTLATDAMEVRRQVSLQTFMQPLFALAQERTAVSGADAVAENRALLQTLSVFANQMPLDRLIGDHQAPEAPAMVVMLHQRNDLGLHFVSAAAIAASAGVGVAEILSNSKEVHDARYGTGFSFSDVTANVAGATLGRVATSSPEAAKLIQERLMRADSESDYMPLPRTDADGLDENSFAAEFGDRSSPVYLERIEEIENSVRALPLYDQIVSPGGQNNPASATEADNNPL